MRATCLLAAAALLFGSASLLARLGAATGAIALISLAVLLALAASGGMSPLGAAYGALGAFAAGLASPGLSAAAGGLLVAGAYVERTSRVRGSVARAVHFVVAVGAGMIAGAMTVNFADRGLAVRAVAVVVAAVLVSLPTLIEADDLMAHALDSLAKLVDEPARRSLLAGADLRRIAADALLDRPTARTVRRTWRALLRLAEARSRVQRARLTRVPSPVAPPTSPASESSLPLSPSDAVLEMLDRRISEHVTALARAYSAVDAARAAELGLDDAALRTAEGAGETLEHVSRAIMDVER
jgi:hypothetical protein